MPGHLEPCDKDCQFCLSGICCNGGWNTTGKCHLDVLDDQRETRRNEPKQAKGKRNRTRFDFQEVYERWWLGKKCRLANGNVKEISKVMLVGPPSFVYGAVWLCFSDGSEWPVHCGDAFRPRKYDVEIVE